MNAKMYSTNATNSSLLIQFPETDVVTSPQHFRCKTDVQFALHSKRTLVIRKKMKSGYLRS